MVIPSNIKLAAAAIALAGVFFAGWQSCSWYRDSVDLARQAAIDEERLAYERRESAIATKVEDKLSELKANERTRTLRIPEIIKQPEFINVCISQDGVDSINAAVRELYDSSDKSNK